MPKTKKKTHPTIKEKPPNKYETNIVPRFDEIIEMLKEGEPEKKIAKKCGVSLAMWHIYKNNSKAFKMLVNNNKREADIKAENSLNKLVNGYHEYSEELIKIRVNRDEEVIKIVKVKKYYPPNQASIAFWLKNRRPKQWKDKTDIENEMRTQINIINSIPRPKKKQND